MNIETFRAYVRQPGITITRQNIQAAARELLPQFDYIPQLLSLPDDAPFEEIEAASLKILEDTLWASLCQLANAGPSELAEEFNQFLDGPANLQTAIDDYHERQLAALASK